MSSAVSTGNRSRRELLESDGRNERFGIVKDEYVEDSSHTADLVSNFI